MHIPERGDIVKINFDPVAGHEQGGLRPALVLSNIEYNNFTGQCVLVPITSKVKGFAYEVNLVGTSTIKGVVLSDHLRSMDWRARKIQFIERVGEDVLDEVSARSKSLLE